MPKISKSDKGNKQNNLNSDILKKTSTTKKKRKISKDSNSSRSNSDSDTSESSDENKNENKKNKWIDLTKKDKSKKQWIDLTNNKKKDWIDLSKKTDKYKKTKYTDKKDLDNFMKEIDEFSNQIPYNDISKTNLDTCDNCNSNKVITDFKKGQRVCRKCGKINGIAIDEFFDTRQYNNDDGCDGATSRFGGSISHFTPVSSIGINILCPNYNKIKKINNQVAVPYHEHKFDEVRQELIEVCRKNKITKNILDEALILYKQVHDTTHPAGDKKGKYIIYRGGTRKGLRAACLYEAFKKRGTPRSHKEVARMFGFEISHVRKGCRMLGEILDKKLSRGNLFDKEQYFKNPNPEDFVDRFSARYKLGELYSDLIKQIIRNSVKLGMATSHTPPSIAAASILLIAKENNLDIDKKQIAELFDISYITVKKPFDKIREHKKILMDDELTDHLSKELHKIKKSKLSSDIVVS